MSGLPASVTEEIAVQLSGGEVKVRPLTVREMRRVQAIKDEETADVVCIAIATGIDESEVRAWIAGATAGDMQKIIKATMHASGIGKDATFPSPTGNDAGTERAS